MASYKKFSSPENFYSYLDKLQFENKAIAIIGSGFAALSILQKIKGSKNVVVFEQGNHFDPLHLKGLEVNNTSLLNLKTQTVEESLGGSSNTWTGRLSEMTANEFLGPQSTRSKDGLIDSIFESLEKKFYKQAWQFFNFDYFYKQKLGYKSGFEERVLPAQKKPMRVSNLLNKIKTPIFLNQKVLFVGSDSYGSFLITSFKNEITKKCYFKKIIIATGGIQSINLINRSIEAGYMTFHQSLIPGIGYMNHPKFSLDNFISGDFFSNSFHLPRYYSEDFTGYSLSNDKKNKLKASNSYFTFQPVYQDENTDEFLVAKNIYSNKKNALNILSNYFTGSSQNVFISLGKIIEYLLFFFKIKALKVRHFNLLFFLEMEPVKTNFITENQNAITACFKLSKNDIKSLKVLYEDLIDEIGLLNVNEKYAKFNIDNIEMIDASHHIGGLSMNNRPEKSFVDQNLQLLGSPDIYICSSSVFPRSGSCNPTLTIVALGLRLGEHINSLD
jgi:hypothetical protein